MRRLRALLLRLAAPLTRGRRERDMASELEAHLQLHVDDNLRAGMTPDEARRQALVALGGVEQTKERVRDARRPVRVLANARQDMRHAVRVLARRPGVAAVLVLTLALGIGANSAIFSAVDAVLLRPLPYGQADQLVNLFERNVAKGFPHTEISVDNFMDWRRQATVFSDTAAYFYEGTTLTGGTEARFLTTARVSVGAFHLLRVAPMLGRDFAQEDAQGAASSVILGYRFWQQAFGGDPGVVGRTIHLAGTPNTVVGVMPASFEFPAPEVDLWRPVTSDLSRLGGRGRLFAYAIARLKPGVGLEQARRDLDRVAAVLAREYPATNAGWGVGVESLQESMVGTSRAVLLIAWAAAALVLVIACSNAAGILLTQAAAREREIAVRAALGAGRRRIAAQMLTESLLLASTSGVVGVGLAALGVRALSVLVVGRLALAERMALDWRVVAFTTLSVAAVALVAGLVPAIKASSVTSAPALKEAGRSSLAGQRRSFRHVFVAGQVSLALVLLVGAGLMGRSVVNLWRTNTGFDPRGVLTFAYALARDPNATAESMNVIHEQVALRLGAVPGVESLAQARVLPFAGEVECYGFRIEGNPASPSAEDEMMVRQVSANFLSALRIPLLRGRHFTAFDRATAEPVAIITRATAARHWPSSNPLDSRVTIAGTTWRVIGVVEDVPTESLAATAKPVVYVPMRQWSGPLRGVSVVVRVKGDPEAMVPALRAAMSTVSKDAPIFGVQTLEQMSGDSIARQRFGALVLLVFAAVALALAVVGIYGTVSNLVVQRRHEIGIRMAVGAGPGDIVRATVGEGALSAAGGILVGVVGAAAAARLLRSLLFGVSTTDPLTYLAMSGLLLLVVGIASWVPGRRAATIDPVAALRGE